MPAPFCAVEAGHSCSAAAHRAMRVALSLTIWSSFASHACLLAKNIDGRKMGEGKRAKGVWASMITGRCCRGDVAICSYACERDATASEVIGLHLYQRRGIIAGVCL